MRLRNGLLLLWGALLIGAFGFYVGRMTAPSRGEVAVNEPATITPAPAEARERHEPKTTDQVAVRNPAPTPVASAAAAETDTRARTAEVGSLESRNFLVPVLGIKPADIHDTFNDKRGTDRIHEASDIMAPRGALVVAIEDGEIAKIFESKPGGHTVYQFDPSGHYAYYYAHLDHYAEGLHVGQMMKRGETIGYVGSTGNASAEAPHLHFAIFELGPEKQWWKGTPINPYPLLVRAASR